MCGQRGLLHETGGNFIEWRGAEILRGSLGVFVRVVVKPFVRPDLHHRRGLVAHHPDGQFTSFHQFFDQNFPVQGRAVGQCSLQLRRFAHEVHTDTRALTGSLHRNRQGQRRPLAGGQHFPARSGNTGLQKQFFTLQLVEGHPTGCLALAGVGNSPALENGLNLAVLPEGAMHHQNAKTGILRQGELRPTHINLADPIAGLTQSMGDRPAGAQGNLPLRSGAAHEDGKMQGSQIGRTHDASSPMICTSVSRRTPCFFKTSARTCSTRASTSEAVAPPSLRIKLA